MVQYFRFQRSLLIFVGVLVFAPIGCRLDNGRSINSNGENEQTSGREGSGQEDDRSGEPNSERENSRDDESEGTSSNAFTGIVRDLLADEPIEGIKVIALSNIDLSELGVEAITGIDGRFTLEGIVDKEICVKLMGTEGEDARIDACSCNISLTEGELEFTSTLLAVARAIGDTLGGGEIVNPQTYINGDVYYTNEAGEIIPVDCAIVEIVETTPDTEVIYFHNAFPDRSMRHTDVSGRILIRDVPSERIHLNAFVDGEKISSVSSPICDAKDATGGLYIANTVHILVDGTDDPTPNCRPE